MIATGLETFGAAQMKSGEEVIDSVPVRPLTKQEITTADPQGNNLQRRDTINI